MPECFSCTRQDLSGLKDRFWRQDQTKGLREKSAVAETQCQLVEGGSGATSFNRGHDRICNSLKLVVLMSLIVLPKLPKVLTAKLTPFSALGDEST